MAQVLPYELQTDRISADGKEGHRYRYGEGAQENKLKINQIISA